MRGILDLNYHSGNSVTPKFETPSWVAKSAMVGFFIEDQYKDGRERERDRERH